MTTHATALPVSVKTLTTLFEFTYQVFKRNTEGVPHDETLRLPHPGGNCINWVGGHIVATRDGLLQLLGQPPVWTDAERETYKRGAPKLVEAARAMSWERIVRSLDASQERLKAGLSALTADRLASAPAPDRNPFGNDSIGEMLAVFTFHESYHVGQLGILRRLSGREGAIR
jgi:hypothetical protein